MLRNIIVKVKPLTIVASHSPVTRRITSVPVRTLARACGSANVSIYIITLSTTFVYIYNAGNP